MDYPGLFHLPRGAWRASSIQVKCENRWSVFFDPDTHEPLNQPRMKAPDAHPIHHHKTPLPKPSTPPPNPLSERSPFRSATKRRCFTHIDRLYDPRRIPCATDVDQPLQIPPNSFKGDDPKRNPFRVSPTVLAQKKLAETETILPVCQSEPPVAIHLSRTRSESTRRAPTPRAKTVPSLFRRSLNPEEEVTPEWARPPYRFQTEQKPS
jgi:hypothetical protein